MFDIEKEVMQHLVVKVQRRLQCEEDLAMISNPDDRVLLASKVAEMKEDEQETCEYLGEQADAELVRLWKQAKEVTRDKDLSIEDAMRWQAEEGNELATLANGGLKIHFTGVGLSPDP